MQVDFHIGEWTVRPRRDCIENGDGPVHVKPKAMAVLSRLASARGEVVTRDELYDSVWPGSAVSDAVLTQCISELRQAFGESAQDAKIIETIPRVGFRLTPVVVPVKNEHGPGKEGAAPGQESSRRLFSKAGLFMIGSALLATVALAWFLSGSREAQTTQAPPGEKTLAVLPFVDMSAARDQAYFADGLSEELTNRLSQLDGLQVASRTASFRFKGQFDDLEKIAQTLGVAYVLEGSVRKDAEQIRITAQLIETASGFHLWSETYDRPLEDIFAVQTEISESVATALSIRLDVGEHGGDPLGTTDIEAYEEYLKAQSLEREFTRESLLMGINHARRAVEIDPGFGYAWYLLSTLYQHVGTFKRVTLGGEWRQLSLEALDRAIALDPDPRAGIAEKADLLVLDKRWSEAQALFGPLTGREAVEDDVINFFYAFFLHSVGRVQEAIPLMEQWLRRHPGSQGAAGGLANMYAAQGRFDEAFAMAERAYDTGGFMDLSALAGTVVAMCADDRQRISEWLSRWIEHSEGEAPAFLQAISETLDDSPSALAILRADDNDAHAYSVSLWAAWHGDADLALDAMRRSDTPFAFWFPVMAEVRRSPGFRELVRDMGLVDYWREYTWADFCRPLGESDFACE